MRPHSLTMAAARGHKENYNGGGSPSPLWGLRKGRGEGCNRAVARGRRAATGDRRGDSTFTQEEVARSLPSPLGVKGGSGAALYTISTLPGNVYSCTDGPAVSPWKGGRPEATPQCR